MTKESPIINILTFHLPFDLANQIYNEFQNRFKEAGIMIKNFKTYQILQNDIKTVELLLALSIFHKRVISNLDGAVKFHGTVTAKSNADTIRMGNYNLTGDEKNKLLAVVISYNKLIQKFSIPSIIMEYYETREFLKNLITLKKYINNAQTNENTNRRNQKDDIPF